MIECYKNGDSIQQYIDKYVNNINLKSNDELELVANNSLNELHNRYLKNVNAYDGDNIHIITTHHYIKDNYKNKLLFYSMNHPSKYLIQFICEQIINILQIQNTINYDIDILNSPKCILYKCISKNVNFNIDDYNPFLHNITNVHDIAQIYYNDYDKIGYK